MTAAAESNVRFSQTPAPVQRLLRMMQTLNFGGVLFPVRGGLPDPDKQWVTRRTVKVAGGENGPRPESDCADFELRLQHLALLDQLAQLEDGAGVAVEVKYGLPFIIEIEQEHEPA